MITEHPDTIALRECRAELAEEKAAMFEVWSIYVESCKALESTRAELNAAHKFNSQQTAEWQADIAAARAQALESTHAELATARHEAATYKGFHEVECDRTLDALEKQRVAESDLATARARIAELELMYQDMVTGADEQHSKLVELGDKLRIERNCAKVDADLIAAPQTRIAQAVAELENRGCTARTRIERALALLGGTR